MKEGPQIAEIAALIGDPARANMLTALMTGKALTASELAAEAGVTLQTASSHLAKLERGRLIHPRKEGRHKYYTLTHQDVAGVLEGLMGLAAGAGHLRTRTGPKDKELRQARVCYNHLAGEKGIRLFDSLMAQGHLHRDDTGGVQLTPSGEGFVTSFGIDLMGLRKGRAALCRECLDWSERRSHLAGSLGRAFLSRFEESGWVRRIPKTRIITFTQSGEQAFNRIFPA